MNAIEMIRGSDLLESEREKYIEVYKQVDSYGHTNHAQGIYWYIEEVVIPRLPNKALIIDVGCGHGEFLQWLRNHIGDRLHALFGADLIAEKIHGAPVQKDKVFYSAAPAWDLYPKGIRFDLLTAFDLLEHIPPSMLPATLREFGRACKGEMIFSIGHRSSKKCGIELHQTIQKMPWWLDYLEAAYPGRVHLLKSTHGLATEYFGVSPP